MSKLTIEEIKKLSLGYDWNPNMSQEDFIAKNNLGDEEGAELYAQIDGRYIQYVYEQSERCL